MNERAQPDTREHLEIAALLGRALEQRPRTSRIIGSLIFLGAGLFYIFAPPTTTTSYFETPMMNMADGILFAFGGIVSGWGTAIKRPEFERLGVAFVVIAGVALVLIQGSVMFFGGEGITWTRGGGTFIYAGFTTWAFDRWRYLGSGITILEKAAEIHDRMQRERGQIPTSHTLGGVGEESRGDPT